MAFIDYGAIAFKNNKLISTDMFTPMGDTCGFSDKDDKESNFDGCYFVVCGDKDLHLGFYKTCLAWHSNQDNYSESTGEEYFDNCQEYIDWKRWEKELMYTYGDKRWEDTTVTVKPKNGYYVATWEYKGDNYKVYFGYGVDLNFYKKTKRVNYYRSPENYFKELTYKIKNFVNKIRRGY